MNGRKSSSSKMCLYALFLTTRLLVCQLLLYQLDVDLFFSVHFLIFFSSLLIFASIGLIHFFCLYCLSGINFTRVTPTKFRETVVPECHFFISDTPICSASRSYFPICFACYVISTLRVVYIKQAMCVLCVCFSLFLSPNLTLLIRSEACICLCPHSIEQWQLFFRSSIFCEFQQFILFQSFQNI